MNENAIDQIERYLEILTSGKPPEWSQLPDIGLYMDQVISYLDRQMGSLSPAGKDKSLTSSMINNYAKAKIIPRAESKKYSQEHIALLISIFMLKKSLSLQDMGTLLDGYSTGDSCREFYGRFRAALTECASETEREIREGLLTADAEAIGAEREAALDEGKLRTLALKLAVEASLRSLAAERLLSMLNPTAAPKEHSTSRGAA